METLVYALFADTTAADAGVATLTGRGIPRHVVSVVEHVGKLADEEVQGPGTRSRANAWIGGVSAGLLAAVLAGVAAYVLDTAVLPTALVAGLGFGLLAALVSGIAGAAIPRRTMTELGREVEAGRVLVTIDLDSKHAADDAIRTLRDTEALRTGTL